VPLSARGVEPLAGESKKHGKHVVLLTALWEMEIVLAPPKGGIFDFFDLYRREN